MEFNESITTLVVQTPDREFMLPFSTQPPDISIEISLNSYC